MTIAVQLTGAAVTRGHVAAVRGVDLCVAQGQWFGLIGANGSGKTSLLRAIAGRLPFTDGSCLIDGVEQVADRAARAERFGFAPPADRLPDALRARDLLALVSGDLDRGWACLGPLRAALGLDDLLALWVGDCSAGMRQRLAIACAFAGGARHVVLDEPFNWLDPVAAFDLREALGLMVADGLTLLTALHDLSVLATACDAGVILADGRITATLDRASLHEAAQDPAGFERRMIARLRTTMTVRGSSSA